ncbi:MAG TPA: HEAT repeat domain-containing protein, partial [Thermosynechococcaceae cyanobacterium]
KAAADPANQQALALALGHLGQPAAIYPLIQLLAAPDPRTRLHAIAALKILPSAYEQLQSLSRSTQPKALQEGVAIALAEWRT